MYEFYTESTLQLQGSTASHIGVYVRSKNICGSARIFEGHGYEVFQSAYSVPHNTIRKHMVLVTEAPFVAGYYMQPSSNYTDRFKELAYGNEGHIHVVTVKYLG
jgi:formylglycine-generating enzyme required for sulfatase activity